MKFVILENEIKTGFSLILNPQLESSLEAKSLVEVIKFLKEKFKFETEVNMLEFGMPPYYKFKEKDGLKVTVALDDYDGLSIDCNSKEFLEDLIPILEKEIFHDSFLGSK